VRTVKKLLITGGAALVLLAVGGPAAVASYRHAEKVARDYGETETMAAWLPLTTDGMLVAALVLMYWRRFIGEPVGKFPWFAFGAGMLATLGANLASAEMTFGGIAVALWPPVCFAITLEIGAMMLKYLPKTQVKAQKQPEPSRDPEPEPEETPAPIVPLPRPPADEKPLSKRQQAIEWSVANWPVTGPMIVEKWGYAEPTAYAIRKDAEKRLTNGHKVS
jgi:hypothetical protein